MREGAGRWGEPPLPHEAHIDPAGQLGFLERHYLGERGGFVREGGAKVKLVLGRTGAGKTHFLGALLALARAESFLTAMVDAAVWPLWGFDHIYRAVVAELDLADLARRFNARLLAELGYGEPGPVAGVSLARWASEQGYDPAPLRVRYDEELHRRLLRNADLDYGYALGLARWCTALAWATDDEDGGLLEHWLRGGRVMLRDCNRLRLRRPADRFTARLWLRSLLHFVRLAGLPGLVCGFDGMGEVLTRRTGRPGSGEGLPAEGTVHYTRQRRDDLFECLRALIDDTGLMPGLLLVMAGPPELLHDTKAGFVSYQALAERLRSEVETVELNRFADEIVLERLWAEDPGAGRLLAERLLTSVAPEADPALRERAIAAAAAQWAARDVAVSAVRRSVLAVLRHARGEVPA